MGSAIPGTLRSWKFYVFSAIYSIHFPILRSSEDWQGFQADMKCRFSVVPRIGPRLKEYERQHVSNIMQYSMTIKILIFWFTLWNTF